MIPRVDVEGFFVIGVFCMRVCFSLFPNHPALTLVKLAPLIFAFFDSLFLESAISAALHACGEN